MTFENLKATFYFQEANTSKLLKSIIDGGGQSTNLTTMYLSTVFSVCDFMLIASRPLVTTPTRFCLILAIMLYLTYLALNDDAVQHFSSSRDPFRHFLTLLLCYGPQWDQNLGLKLGLHNRGRKIGSV